MTRELRGITILLAIYFAGEVISRLLGGFVPGSVMGMLLLFALLQHGTVKEDDVRSVAEFILKNMMLFFVPVTIGVVESYKILGDNWISITAILLATTLLVMITVGLLQQKLGARWRR